MKRKGIILAGGSGTRLYPATAGLSKQLMPVYDKPLIYYPLTTLMLSGIREILVISTPRDTPRFAELLGTGSQWGIHIEYAVQETPRGVADALIVGHDFLAGHPCALVLGDNIFYGHDLVKMLQGASDRQDGATIFAHHVTDPERYGVITFDELGRAVGVEEKPAEPLSSYAVTGLYFFDGKAADFVAELTPSARGELEITDIIRKYFEFRQLNVEVLGRGFAWLDAGTHDSLLEAARFIATLQKRQGLMVACPEEIALGQKWIDPASLKSLVKSMATSSYGKYLHGLLK